MKILIIDNTIDLNCWGSGELTRVIRSTQETVLNATLITRRAPQRDLPTDPRDFDRIIVSGSKTSILDDAPWIEELFDFIRKTVEAQVPFLGICYGHQALVRALGGKDYVRRSSTGEFGWTQIEVSQTSQLFAGIPRTFYSFSSHFEEVSHLPARMRPLASSQACSIQACQLENLPVYGIQFHPEKTPEAGAELVQARISKKVKGFSPLVLNLNKGHRLYQASIGETLFRNFISSSGR